MWLNIWIWKKNFTAFLQIIYLNFGANNTYEIQQFFIYPWTRYGPHWTCFGPVVQKKSMWTSIEIALTARWPGFNSRTRNFFQVRLINTMSKNQKLRRPGIEPGSTAWKAAMLTIIPPTPCWLYCSWVHRCLSHIHLPRVSEHFTPPASVLGI